MTIGRRSFFTAIGAAVAAVKTAPSEQPVVFSSDACILCGFWNGLSPWGSIIHPGVMRCSDKTACQARQIDALLGTLTPWQKKTGVVVARGKRR